ncbi:MAG: hypothetical protein JWM53_6573 [bacterium]|nr:hypothetical protein [bacterium]
MRRLALLLLVAAGCSSAPNGPELLSWRIADGRDCYSAGIIAVETRPSPLLDTMPLASTRCADGLAPAAITVDNAPASGTLYLDGVDNLGVDLYHGELSLDAAPPGTGETRVVTLYAAAAQ